MLFIVLLVRNTAPDQDTIGRNSILAGRTPEIECADVAKNSYCRYFSVCRQLSRMSPLYSSKM